MKNDRVESIAKKIVEHSLSVTEGQRVMIHAVGPCESMIESIIRKLYMENATPNVKHFSHTLVKSIIKEGSEEQFKQMALQDISEIEASDGFIGIKAEENIYEYSDIDKNQYTRYVKSYLQPVQMSMAELKRWVILKYPTHGMAQLAGISLDSLEDIYYRACILDFGLLKDRAKRIGDLLRDTNYVRITAPDTDLHFNVKDIPHFFCDGKYNLPDGEIFTAPVLDSVEGEISFNLPISFLGRNFENVKLEFKQGKIINAKCNDIKGLWDILHIDEGAQRVGEFGIGLNPSICRPMNNILFDEKMAGSIHIALGQAYEMAYNGNESSIHWDMVLCLHKEYGGGEIYFDNELILKDGVLLLP